MSEDKHRSDADIRHRSLLLKENVKYVIMHTGYDVIFFLLFPMADMIPVMILVMPCSWIWVTCVLPLDG